MGIFDFFKKKERLEAEKESEPQKQDGQKPQKFDPHTQLRTDTCTVYYAYGHVIKVFPPIRGPIYEGRDIINGADFIVSDGTAYDLTDIESIKSIAIPNYNLYRPNKIGEELGVTGFLEYVLRMKSGQLWNEEKYELSIAVLGKATELMKHSNMGWPAKDFFGIVNELNNLGCFEKAKQWTNWILKNVPGAKAALSPSADDKISYHAKEHFKKTIESCKDLATDLVETGDVNGCCPICAMYRNRVFSLSGKDKRFPKFPEDFHFGCGLSAYPYKEGVMEPAFRCKNVVQYSNRPFVDDRTDEEKKNYVERMEQISKDSPAVRGPNLAKIIYLRLKNQLPDIAPKSFSGFQRMRNANSKNYQALVSKAEAAGFVFPTSLEEVTPWEGID